MNDPIVELMKQEREKSVEALAGYWISLDQYQQIDNSFQLFLTNLQEYLYRGGKMVRPWLTKLSYQTLKPKIRDLGAIELGAVAGEVYHRYILAHDDIFDQDLYRHGGPTLEKVYQSEQESMKVKSLMKTYPMGMAMISGNILHSLTYDMIAKSGFSPEIQIRAIKAYVQCGMETCAGWRLESILKQKSMDQVTVEQVEKAMTLVSAQYSVRWPLRMGQIYAGVELDQYHQAFEVYGLKVGLAFQMIDDVLGIFGEEKITGKPAGADLREGKKSLLLLEGYKRATASEKLLINSACGKTKITKSEVEEVKGIVKQNGALDWILKQSEDMASEGIEAINELKNTENGRTVELLQNLGKFLAKRDF